MLSIWTAFGRVHFKTRSNQSKNVEANPLDHGIDDTLAPALLSSDNQANKTPPWAGFGLGLVSWLALSVQSAPCRPAYSCKRESKQSKGSGLGHSGRTGIADSRTHNDAVEARSREGRIDKDKWVRRCAGRLGMQAVADYRRLNLQEQFIDVTRPRQSVEGARE